MPQEAIDRVNQIGRSQKMPSILTFANRYGREIGTRLEDLHPAEYDPESNADESVLSEDEASICGDHILEEDDISEQSEPDLDN